MKNLHILFLILVLIGFANAQDSVLSGTVFDSQNKVIQNAKISAIKKNTGKNLERFETNSDSNGNYTIKLKQGEYLLEFYAEGFKRTKVENFKIGLAENLRFNTKLDVSGFFCELPSVTNEDEPVKFCGTITDDVGAIVQNAKVEIKLNNKKTFVTYSNENGEFNIEIPTGVYKITISAESFKKTVLKNQTIDSESECFTFKLKSNIPPHQIT